MDHYIAISNTQEIKRIYSKEQLIGIDPGSVLFICKREVNHPYGYGDHSTYTFCDTHGIESPLRIDDYSISSFKTHGIQRDYILSWAIKYKDFDEELYSLHLDRTFYIRPRFYEWDNPISDTIGFIHDLHLMGLQNRKEIDSLKRAIYQKDGLIEQLKYNNELLRNIDYAKSGVTVSYYRQGLPSYNDKYESFINSTGIKDAPEKIIDFLSQEMSKRDNAIQILTKDNQKFESIASKLDKVSLKDGVDNVASDQFYACKNANTIILPPSVISLVHDAFNCLSLLQDVYFLSNRIVKLKIGFPHPGIMSTKAQFYVPITIVDEYKNDFFWRTHANKFIGKKLPF